MFELEKIAILGASRGLGAAFAKELSTSGPVQKLVLYSRSKARLDELAENINADVDVIEADFTKSSDQQKVLESLEEIKPTRIYYFAGGGPFGKYGEKNWKDHQWALEVTLLFPAKLLFEVLSQENLSCVKQIIFIGSDIAESQPHPMGASYGAAKRGLLGLVSSVNAEKPDCDVRIFSPGYMDTDLLPKNALPRREGKKIHPPEKVASELLQWSAKKVISGHYVYS